MIQEAIKNGFMIKDGKEDLPSNTLQKRSDMTLLVFPSEVSKKVYEAIKLNRKAKYSWLADNFGVSEATVKRSITTLKELGLINAQHSKVKGEWQLIEKK